VIFERIVACIPGSDFSSVLYITPAAFSLREARKEFLSYLKKHRRKNVYIPFRSAALQSLCGDLFETHGREDILSDRVSPIILCELLGEKNIGNAHLLSDLLGRIRHSIPGKELAFVKEEVKSLIFEEKTKGHAVKAIEVLERYERELKAKGLVDFEKALIQSIPFIKEHICPDILVLDGFFDPTPLECGLIKSFIECSGTFYVLVEESAEFLKFLNSSERPFETQRLKATCSRKSAGYFVYPSMEDEVDGVAKRIKGHILEGVKPSEIIVSSPSLTKYIPMFKRVFKKYGIPVDITGYDLSSTGPFVALEALIATIEDDYPRGEFLSFLTSPYFPNIPAIIRDRAVSISREAGIVKGRQSWLSAIKTLMNSAEKKISPEIKNIYDEFQRQIKGIITTLEVLRVRGQESPVSFAEGLEEVLTAFGFFDSIGSVTGPLGEDMSRFLDNLFSELKVFSEYRGQGEVSIEKSGMYLRHLIRGLQGSYKDAEGVRIIPFELAAGLESRTLFFCGMIEGELPSRPPIDPILPENVKKALGLPFLEYYLDRQKRYFRRMFHTSHDEPHFSFPVAEGDAIFLPSPFLDWNMRMNPLAMNISTEEEILMREGALSKNNFSTMLWNGKIIVDKDIHKYLLKRFEPETFCRVTEIEAYRQCPLRFYIEKFLCLERQEAPKYEVEARLWGRLAHKTMEYLYEDTDIPFDMMRERLFLALEKGLKDFFIGDFWADVARGIFQRLFPLLKEQENRLRGEGFNPFMMEQNLRVKVNGLGLKGKVDRVDSRKLQIKNSQSQKDTRNPVVLLDYKTGAIDRDSLQLPLYACMWQKEHTEPVEKTGFYSLRNGEVEWFPKKKGMEVYMKEALQKAEDIVEKIRKGMFSPAPSHEGLCRYCSHSAVCKGAK
jgi:CRISPR/Cas system-associated exonuclease Cas4 (RecB family)